MSEVIDRMVSHAGTSPVASQIVLALMMVVLGIVLLGIGYGFLNKNGEGIRLHRWTNTVSLVITMLTVFLIMLPTFYNYYIDPDVEFYSSLSITTIVHGIVGFPAIVTGLIYAFGDLPNKRRKWMRITAVFWLTAISLGIILYFQMLSM